MGTPNNLLHAAPCGAHRAVAAVGEPPPPPAPDAGGETVLRTQANSGAIMITKRLFFSEFDCTSVRRCYATPSFSGFPIKGDEFRNCYITPAFSGALEWAKVVRNPCVL